MPRRRRCAAPSPIPGEERPVQRNAANARERARMRVLSKAFCRLKTTLPWVPADTKLSKLDTLRLATSYIAHLRAILTDEAAAEVAPLHPLNLTWPFSFQQQSQGSVHPQGQQGWQQESRDWTPSSLERGANSTDHDMDDDDDDEDEEEELGHRHHHSTYQHHHHHHQFSDSLLHLG